MRAGLEQQTVAFLVVAGGLSGCATPAVKVQVPTMSVAQAWNAAAATDLGASQGRLISGSEPGVEAPIPIVTAPDIRLAYVRSWTDEFGNRHFGSWVAIQVEAPRWVRPDGSVDVPAHAAVNRTPAPLR